MEQRASIPHTGTVKSSPNMVYHHMYVNNVISWLSKQKKKFKEHSHTGGKVVPFFCAFTISWWKLTLLLPHNYFAKGKSLTQSQIISSPTRTSLAKRKGFLGSCEEKYSLLLSDSAEDSTSCLCGWKSIAIFPEGSAALASTRDFFVQKARVYEPLREDIIKMSGHWADYTDAASTPEMIYIYVVATENICLMTWTIFTDTWYAHSSKHSFYKFILLIQI